MAVGGDMRVYYNDTDLNCINWLRELMKEGLIPRGELDSRSIVDVDGAELAAFDQCHFFAGIGGWAYALQLAGWNEPCWTGSCPCQPFSAAGKRQGFDDERHLWPEFYRLIAECGPSTVFGEQVESKDGRIWLSRVREDVEGLDYAFGASDLCAAGVGAPHLRQRLYWLAHSEHTERRSLHFDREDGRHGSDNRRQEAHSVIGTRGEICGLEHAESDGRIKRRPEPGGRGVVSGCGDGMRLGDADEPGPQGRGEQPSEYADQRAPWARGQSIACLDGKARRVEPSVQPLAHGVSGRVGLLRGYGNAIVPQVAAEFIGAFMDIHDAL